MVAVNSGHTRANSSRISRRLGRSTPRLSRLRLRYGSRRSQHHEAITAARSVSWRRADDRSAPRALGVARREAGWRLGRRLGHPLAPHHRPRLVLDRPTRHDLHIRRRRLRDFVRSPRRRDMARTERRLGARHRHDRRASRHARLSSGVVGHGDRDPRGAHRRPVASPLWARRDPLESTTSARARGLAGLEPRGPADRARGLRRGVGALVGARDERRVPAGDVLHRRGSVGPDGLPSRLGLLLQLSRVRRALLHVRARPGHAPRGESGDAASP